MLSSHDYSGYNVSARTAATRGKGKKAKTHKPYGGGIFPVPSSSSAAPVCSSLLPSTVPLGQIPHPTALRAGFSLRFLPEGKSHFAALTVGCGMGGSCLGFSFSLKCPRMTLTADIAFGMKLNYKVNWLDDLMTEEGEKDK